MPCETIKFGDSVGIICSRGRRRRVFCHKCRQESEFQCDFPTNKNRAGKVIKTCDRHLCKEHARHGATAGVDFCDEHYPIAKAAYNRKLAQQAGR